MPFSLRQIKYFVAAAEIGQVSQAAHHLKISQSAVTTAIQELEKTLKTKLFIRVPQGVALTESGKHFLNHAYSILEVVQNAISDPAPTNEIDGQLNIATSFDIMGYILPYHIKKLSTAYPNLTINLHECDHKEIEAGLLNGRFDMALVLASNVQSMDIISEILLSSPRHLWLSAAHPLAKKNTISFADIADEPYVQLNVNDTKDVGESYWSNHGKSLNLRLTTTSIEAARNMVANEIGVTILPDIFYKPWSLEGKPIVMKNLVTPVASVDIGLAWVEQKKVTPAIRCVQDYFRRTHLIP